MDRQDFEALRDQLDRIISPVKYRLAEEVYLPAAFGSMHAIWRRRGGAVRLVWDGKEGLLSIETLEDEVWTSLAAGARSDGDQVLKAARDLVS